MSRTIQTDTQNFNGLDNSNGTTIRRTIVERGVRQTSNNDNPSGGGPSTSSAIITITKQREDEQRELQELNSKLSSYLGHVLNLETYNGQLLAELEALKDKWGLDTERLNAAYAPQLKTLRNGIDSSLHDRIFEELQLKQNEYDMWQTEQRINTLGDDAADRINKLQQDLNNSVQDLEKLKTQYDRRSADLLQKRSKLENLGNEFDGLQSELLNQRLERLMVENELQTLREEAAFQDAIYQAQREEILTLSIPAIDSSAFYRNELANAISDIRQDFEIHSQTQNKELEEYYRIKTEEIQEKIAQDNERRRLLTSETRESTFDSSMYADLLEEYKELKSQQTQLQTDLTDTLDDLERIRDEQSRESEKYNSEINQLQQELESKQTVINEVLENNISLRFELSTYRNLLNGEEKRLNKMEQEEKVQTSLSSSSNQVQASPPSSPNLLQYNTDRRPSDFKVQKMAVKKSSKGL